MRLSVSINSRWIWVSVIFLLIAFYFIFDPLEYIWMPQCVFHKLTGLKCMGCGAQRMLHAVLHGDLREAFEANAFLLCSMPAICFLLYLEIFRNRYINLYRRVHSLPVIITAAALLMAWLLLRNILSL